MKLAPTIFFGLKHICFALCAIILVGWWAGISEEKKHPHGQLIHIKCTINEPISDISFFLVNEYNHTCFTSVTLHDKNANMYYIIIQIEMMSEAIDVTLDKDEAEEDTEELTNQVRQSIFSLESGLIP